MSSITLPANSNVQFVESVVGFKIENNAVINHLGDKETLCKQNDVNTRWDSGRQAEWWQTHAGHIVMLPFKVGCLAFQTAVDALILWGVMLLNMAIFGLDPDCRKELVLRAYNLFVADTLTWLSIIPSLFEYSLYDKANALHLGTLDYLQLRNRDEFDKIEVKAQPEVRELEAFSSFRYPNLNRL